jgi:penicillin-binding protein 2
LSLLPKGQPEIAIAILVENGGLGNDSGTNCQLNDRKYLRKKITRTDLETRVLNISLKDHAILGHEGRSCDRAPLKTLLLKKKTTEEAIDSTKQN